MNPTARMLALALLFAGCDADLSTSNGIEGPSGLLVTGNLPADYDLDAATAELEPGQILVIGTPGESELTTVERIDPDRSSTFTLDDVTCIGCGDPTCATMSRSMQFDLMWQSGDSGEHRAWPIGSENFTPVSTEETFTANTSGTSSVTFAGVLGTCATFGLVIDVESSSGGTSEPVFNDLVGLGEGNWFAGLEACSAPTLWRQVDPVGWEWTDGGTTMPTAIEFEMDGTRTCGSQVGVAIGDTYREVFLNGAPAGSFYFVEEDCTCTSTGDSTTLVTPLTDVSSFVVGGVNRIELRVTDENPTDHWTGAGTVQGLAGTHGEIRLERP